MKTIKHIIKKFQPKVMISKNIIDFQLLLKK